MIFNNKALTEELMDYFGEEVLGWSYDKIRTKLDEAGEEALNRLDNTETRSLKAHMYVMWQEVRILEDKFMELYTGSLDSVEEI